jgi:hypothetical protein
MDDITKRLDIIEKSSDSAMSAILNVVMQQLNNIEMKLPLAGSYTCWHVRSYMQHFTTEVKQLSTSETA